VGPQRPWPPERLVLTNLKRTHDEERRGERRRPRPISTAQLHRLPGVHLPPINQLVLLGSYLTRSETSHLGVGFALRCFQRLSRPDIATELLPLAEQLAHHWSVHPGPLVLGTAPRKRLAPTTDRDRTVSRRSEPSSRAALMGEQPNPWDRLQPQDATSRHRGAKPCRRCELLGRISLLSPG
jgi:hypothetical protein